MATQDDMFQINVDDFYGTDNCEMEVVADGFPHGEDPADR